MAQGSTVYRDFAANLLPFMDDAYNVAQGYVYPREKTRAAYAGQGHVHFGWVQEDEITNRFIPHLYERRGQHDGIYVGVGGMINLAMLVAMRAPAAILIDVNANQTLFWHALFDLVARSETKEAFARGLYELPERIRQHRDFAFQGVYGYRSVYDRSDYDAETGFAHFVDEDFDAMVWRVMEESPGVFDDDEGYEHLRRMVLNHAIGAVTVSLFDPERMRRLGDYVAQRGAKVDVMYLSSVRMLEQLHADANLLNDAIKQMLVRGLDCQTHIPPLFEQPLAPIYNILNATGMLHAHSEVVDAVQLYQENGVREFHFVSGEWEVIQAAAFEQLNPTRPHRI